MSADGTALLCDLSLVLQRQSSALTVEPTDEFSRTDSGAAVEVADECLLEITICGRIVGNAVQAQLPAGGGPAGSRSSARNGRGPPASSPGRARSPASAGRG